MLSIQVLSESSGNTSFVYSSISLIKLDTSNWSLAKVILAENINKNIKKNINILFKFSPQISSSKVSTRVVKIGIERLIINIFPANSTLLAIAVSPESLHMFAPNSVR